MPSFIRLTDSPSGARVTVNADLIQFLGQRGNLTTIFFVGSDFPSIYCIETHEEIMDLIPVRT